MSDRNSAVVNRLINEVINEGKYQVIQEVVDEHYFYQAGEISLEGKESLEHLLRGYRTAFPDLKITVSEQLVSGEKVVTRGRLKGTHLGNFNELPASGNVVDVDLIIMSQIKGGKIIKEFEMIDEISMLRQLGVDGI